MCGNFNCLKNSLLALNIFYVIVSFILIGVAAYGKAANMITSLPIVGGIIACGVFLLFISIAGLVGAIRHHQVTLFFYMIILFLLFVIQFSIACACLAVNDEQQVALAEKGWQVAPDSLKRDVQKYFSCCGINETESHSASCAEYCEKNCQSCLSKLQGAINYGFRISGGIGLFFSFTEIIGFTVAYRLRNMANPATGITDMK